MPSYSLSILRHDQSSDLFTFDRAWANVIAGYGLAALVYLFIGHAVAGRIRR